MKKVLILVMLIVLCVPIFFACDNNSTIWITTNAKLAEFLNGETVNYDEFIEGNITFSSELETKRDEIDSQFYDLTYYETILGACFANVQKHIGSFTITPIQNLNQATSQCLQINGALSDLTAEIEVFNTTKQKFLTDTNSLSFDNVIAISKLNSFKKSFYNLIKKANTFNQTFTNAYATLYGGIVETDTANSNTVYNSVGVVYADLINTYITYGFAEFNGNCADENNFYNSILSLKTKLSTSECNSTNYASWLTFYQSYQSEKSMFLTALANMDLTADNSNPTEIQQVYLNKINSFVNTNASLFINKTITLFN
ncbi:MAG: hypothetical protein PHQ62_04215 [Clostridia bacterium]|nr:hypothetical protein [Clostridia bacterium]